MEKEIINKVANSVLEVFDLEDYFPKQPILSIDISQWLVSRQDRLCRRRRARDFGRCRCGCRP